MISWLTKLCDKKKKNHFSEPSRYLSRDLWGISISATVGALVKAVPSFQWGLQSTKRSPDSQWIVRFLLMVMTLMMKSIFEPPYWQLGYHIHFNIPRAEKYSKAMCYLIGSRPVRREARDGEHIAALVMVNININISHGHGQDSGHADLYTSNA